MNSKWYLGTFILILSILGVNLQQFSIPNQEIVVQFDNEDITTLETKNTLAIVKEQLQEIGVTQIQVLKDEKGRLKISYFSDVDIVSVKKALSEKRALGLSYTSIFDKEHSEKPVDKEFYGFQLEVFEIQKNTKKSDNGNGLVVELLPDNDRFFNPDVYYSSIKQKFSTKCLIEKTAYNFYNTVSLEIDNSSNKIPEVRAGPFFI